VKPWFKPAGVLDPKKHERLIANRANYASDAGIPVELIWKALPALTPGELSWLSTFKRHRSEGYCGLLLTGENPVVDPLEPPRSIQRRAYPLWRPRGTDCSPLSCTFMQSIAQKTMS
jgi:hypothetical protein